MSKDQVVSVNDSVSVTRTLRDEAYATLDKEGYGPSSRAIGMTAIVSALFSIVVLAGTAVGYFFHDWYHKKIAYLVSTGIGLPIYIILIIREWRFSSHIAKLKDGTKVEGWMDGHDATFSLAMRGGGKDKRQRKIETVNTISITKCFTAKGKVLSEAIKAFTKDTYRLHKKALTGKKTAKKEE